MISLTEDKRMLGYELFGSYSNISHFVTTRQGGCSQGAYGTFNCSPYCGDEAERVLCNQEWLMDSLPQRPRELIIPLQTHGTQVRLIDASFLASSVEERRLLLDGVDALMSCQPGYCLCISTADCIPVLLYDPVHQAVAAIHAGWRGTVRYIVSQTLDQMHTAFGTQGDEVMACIGPGISFASFEVGDEVYETFRLQGFDVTRLSTKNDTTGKYHIDLCEANRQQLLDFGVPSRQIELAGICTYLHHQQFFSARRLGIKSGRILSGIMIK